MTRKESGGNKYVVRLSDEERDRLNALINAGKHPARKLLKARTLLKADVSVAGEGWSDARIAEALDTSTDTVLRTRQRLVEEGVEHFAAISQSNSMELMGQEMLTGNVLITGVVRGIGVSVTAANGAGPVSDAERDTAVGAFAKQVEKIRNA